MKVLSLFDGMSCGRIALERAGISVDTYYSSEIDKWANKVSEENYPDIVRLGDVTKWKEWDLPKIDMIIGGSPCQGFSFAGKQLAFDDPRSALFFEFVDIIKHYKPKYFLLENVRMKKEYLKIISDTLGVEPICINSALVSAQNRVRYYWTNIPSICQPEDKGILLKDIVEGGIVDRNKIRCGAMRGRYIINGKRADHAVDSMAGKTEQRIEMRSDNKTNCLTTVQKDNLVVFRDKSQTIPATIHKENAKSMVKRNKLGLLVGETVNPSPNGLIHVGNADLKGNECIKRVYSKEGKGLCLTTMGGGHREPKIAVDETKWRKLTPLECERLQTVPDNYTNHVSNTQRYKMLGNGWTVDVIAHIFSGINKKTKKENR